jgi:hypothetical protein
MYECDVCNTIFNTKQHLIQHINKKNKCNVITPFYCEPCNKYYKTKINLNDHINRKKCIITEAYKKSDQNIIIYENISELYTLLNSDMIKDKKIYFINKLTNLTNDEINDILDMNITIEQQYNLLNKLEKIVNKTQANINNGTINSNTINTENSNNITQNIQINTFGQEKIDYLDKEYFKNLIMNQHIEKGYIQLIKDIYLNKEHPENKTVKVDNINNKYALVYNNDKWDTMLKSDLKEMLHKKNYTVLKMHYDKLKKSMSVPKREETNAFLSRDETGDPHMMYVIDKIILLFYNDGEVEDLADKYKINKNK